jgi:ribA/ribD-fused uncharacterized protein
MITLENFKKTYDPNTTEFLFFWGHRPNKNGLATKSIFSQWWYNHTQYDIENGWAFDLSVYQFVDEQGNKFRSTEHYMMYHKALLFKDIPASKMVLTSSTPNGAKKIGRKVKNFDNKIWEANRYEIVKNGNILKFEQNTYLLDFLMSTVGKTLVEASPYDEIWGIALGAKDKKAQNPATWKGLNLLGFILTDIRDNYFTK